MKRGADTAIVEGHTKAITALAVLPDGRLASASDDRTVRLWDVNRGTETARLEGHTEAITALAVLPDGRLASASDDGTVRLWDVKRGVETARLDGATTLPGVKTLAVLPDGRLATGGWYGSVRLWDVKRGVQTAHLEGHTRAGGWIAIVNTMAALPDGRLAWVSEEERVRLWDPTSGAETAPLEGHTSWITALAVLPDGQLASASQDGTVRLWDVKRGVETDRLEAPEISKLAVLPDGRLALASHDRTVRLWDVKRGVETARLEGHNITALAVLLDGRLALASHDRTVRLWDLKTGAETASLPAQPAPIDNDFAIRHSSEPISPALLEGLRAQEEALAKLRAHLRPVACSVFAPAAMRSGTRALVQVFLHASGDEEKTASLAHQVDPERGRQITQELDRSLEHGRKVEVFFETKGLALSKQTPRRQALIWAGQPTSVYFDVKAPWAFFRRMLLPVIIVSVDGEPIGRIAFRISVGVRQRTAAPWVAGNLIRYRRAFLSYASSDRGEVLKRAHALRLAGIDFFQDILHLEAGERWKRRLFEEIDKADIFYLFWSHSARRSKWVRREARYANARQKISPSGAPDIVPVILDVPPPSPPSFLKHLHFGDPISSAIALNTTNSRE
jgi:WD40 repeat protein